MLNYLLRPGNSWVIGGSALGLTEEAVEFAAGRIEGALLLFRAVVDQWAAVGLPQTITRMVKNLKHFEKAWFPVS
jgi:hypothetical protein